MMRYKPLDDATRAQCITLLKLAMGMAKEYEKMLETAGMALHGVLQALETQENDPNAENSNES